MALKLPRDGFTRTVTLSGAAFTFRPLRARDLIGDKKSDLEVMAKNLTAWEVEDESGVALPISAETMGLLPVRLQADLLDAMTDPDWLETAQKN